jgi:hypothetical protein
MQRAVIYVTVLKCACNVTYYFVSSSSAAAATGKDEH